MKLKDLYITVKQKLKSFGIEDYEFESICLIEKNLKLTKQDIIIFPEKNIDDILSGRLLSDVIKRKHGVPLQYILGEWEFYGMKFYVGTGVLIPRADTEICVNEAINYLENNNCEKVVDLCSGSGIIAIVLGSKYNNLKIDAIELSSLAYEYLTKNISYNKVSNIKSIKEDIFKIYSEYEKESLDLIISNPPYIKTDEINDLQLEVKHEPLMALDGGKDGLDYYRKIVEKWTPILKKDKMIIFEIGEDQGQAVSEIMKDSFYNIKVIKDYNHLDRVVTGIKK